MPKSFLQLYPGQLRLPDIRPLPDGRFQLADYVQFPAPKWATPTYGALHPFDGDVPADEQARWGGLRLIRIDPGTAPGKPSVPALIYLYEQIHATAETQVGKLTRTTDENGREVVEAQFIQFSSNPYVKGTTGVTTPPGLATAVLSGETMQDEGILRRITRRYIEATASEVQVGRDTITTDENNRQTLTRQFVQLSSAAYAVGTVGSTVSVGGRTFALSQEEKQENVAVRTITRRWIEATASEVQVGNDQITVDDNGRRVLQRTFIQLASAAYVQGTTGTAVTVNTVAYALDQEQKQENAAVRTITRRWVEVTDALVQVGASAKITDPNGRVSTEARFVIRAAASYTPGVVGITTAPGDANSVLDQEQDQATSAVRTIVRRYVQATSSFVQVGPDILDRELNGLLRVRRRSIATAATALPTRTVGTTTALSGTVILAGTSTEGSSSAVTLFTETYLQPGIIEAEKRFDDDLGVLYVTFRSVGTKFTPTALNPPATLTSDPVVAFQGGSAASVIRDRIQNTNGYRTFLVTVMLAASGAALPTDGTNSETRTYQDYIDYQRPGSVTFSSSEGFNFFPGTSRSVLVSVKEYISTSGDMPASSAWRPFSVKSWANCSISYKPVGQNFSTVVSKGASGYLADLTTTLTGGDYVGVPIQVGVASASSDPTPAAFFALNNPILSAKNVGSFVADTGTVWYRKRLVTLVGTFGTALDY